MSPEQLEKKRLYMREYRRKNGEHVRELQRAYRAKNLDRIHELESKWRKLHYDPEKESARKKQYRRNNPERERASARAYVQKHIDRYRAQWKERDARRDKAAHAKAKAEWYQRNKERLVEKQKAKRATPEGRAAKIEQNRRYVGRRNYGEAWPVHIALIELSKEITRVKKTETQNNPLGRSAKKPAVGKPKPAKGAKNNPLKGKLYRNFSPRIHVRGARAKKHLPLNGPSPS